MKDLKSQLLQICDLNTIKTHPHVVYLSGAGGVQTGEGAEHI